MNILPEGLTVNSIAGPWTNRDRVPLVTVIRDYETQTLTLSQVCALTIIACNLTEQKTLLTSETQKKHKDSDDFHTDKTINEYEMQSCISLWAL